MSIELNFEQFNTLLDQWMCNTFSFQTLFGNQMTALMNVEAFLQNATNKIEQAHGKFCDLMCAQQLTDCNLNVISAGLDRIEQLIGKLERSNCICCDSFPDIKTRSDLYGSAESVYLDLNRCNVMLQALEQQALLDSDAKSSDSAKMLFRVLDSNLKMLEKIAMHMDKMKICLGQIEQAKNCYCCCGGGKF